MTLACSDDGSTEAGTSSETSGDGDGDGDPAGDGDGDPSGDGDGDPAGDGDGDLDPSACPEPFSSMVPNTELPPPFTACPAVSPCDVVEVNLDQTMSTGGDEDVLTPAALECVLSGLAGGARADYSFSISSSISSESLTLSVYEDGHAELARDAVYDSAFEVSRTPHDIDANAGFEDCAMTLLWSDVWSCVSAGLLDCSSWAADAQLCPG